MLLRIGVIKIGNIGAAPLLEFLFDERAEREDIDIRVVGSGSKLLPEQAEEVTKKLLEFEPKLVLVISPNAALPGPTKIRELLTATKIPAVVISDGPGKKAVEDIEAKGMGYIIIPADAMIGARREFLDPLEMALFNADVISVLTITGVFSIIYQELDKVIEQIKRNEDPTLPKIIANSERAVEAADFQNPYAKAKAMAAYEMTKQVAGLNAAGCFKIKEWEKYVQTVTAAHEMLRMAAKLANESREIEKYGDHLLRRPHHDDGRILKKRKLMQKPK
ncbi:MAG: F420-dependent methylenetetrahydromethanopterin dehydrogenase [Candidatus Hodarchaeota archaeon]